MIFQFIVFTIIPALVKLQSINPTFKPIPTDKLPHDFPKFRIEGESTLKTDIFIAPRNLSNFETYAFLINYKGEVLNYKKAYDPKLPLIHKNKEGKRRYTYYEHLTEPIAPIISDTPGRLVVLDENFQLLKTLRLLEYGDVPNGTPVSHDYLYLDDNHFVLVGMYRNSNIPHFAIQEQIDGRVVFHWQSDYIPDIVSWSSMRDKYEGQDWAHFNAIKLDRDNNFIISCRSIGIMKIIRETGQVAWVIGRAKNDFNLPLSKLPYLQHDVRILEDGSITVWDNQGLKYIYSRGLKYKLDEQNMKVDYFREYIYKSVRRQSECMGGFQILDDENDIVSVTFGGRSKYSQETIAFEEYDFKNNSSKMRFYFQKKYSTYRVTRIFQN